MKSKTPRSRSHKSTAPKLPYADGEDAPPRMKLTAYIDGGSRGNPGIAGYGVYILNADGRPVHEMYGFLGVRTNNYAEYSALLAALRYALRVGGTDLQVFSDSELLVRQINGVYKVNHPDLRVLYAEAQNLIRRFDRFTIQHVYRDQNKEADRLANQAMDARASSPD